MTPSAEAWSRVAGQHTTGEYEAIDSIVRDRLGDAFDHWIPETVDGLLTVYVRSMPERVVLTVTTSPI